MKAYAISFNYDEPSLYGGNKPPAWFDKLSELKALTTWPEAEKAIKELGFCRDNLKSVNRLIALEKEEITRKHGAKIDKLSDQIAGLYSNLTSYFESHPDELGRRKATMEQLNVEVEEIHKYKIKFHSSHNAKPKEEEETNQNGKN